MHGIDAHTLLGGALLDDFENFRHAPQIHEIVAGLQCQPLDAQIPHLRVMRDGALRMAAYLPGLWVVAGTEPGVAAAAAATAAAAAAGVVGTAVGTISS